MRQFLQMLKRFAAPYKGYVIGSVFLNILSAVFNIFSVTRVSSSLYRRCKMETTFH